MWVTYWSKGSARKKISSRFLLAKGSFGHNGVCAEVCQLPKMCKRPKAVFVSDPVDTTYLPLTRMGNGYNWPNASYPRKPKIRNGRSWVFIKMDRSKGPSDNNFSYHSKVLLAKHHLSLQSVKVHYYRQWHLVWLRSIQSILQSSGNKHTLFFS
jgi:hypothetical protein